jgi:hypothetical protein
MAATLARTALALALLHGAAARPAAAQWPAQVPPATPGAPSTPVRTQLPWSQAPIPPLAIGEVQQSDAAGGAAWRIGTPRGPVVAWRPPGYRSREAGVVVYLHGYFTSADQAVADHKLFGQFLASGRNALFVVPEAPAWNGEETVWPSLAGLLEEVFARTGLTPPPGPLVVAAHSGGFRPTLLWLGEPRLEEILLLDGLYRSEDQFRGWLESGPPGGRRRLVLVGDETAAKGDALAAATPGGVVLPRVPAARPGLDGAARTARLVSIRSQYPHMAIVESGEVLPVLLQATRLPAVR